MKKNTWIDVNKQRPQEDCKCWVIHEDWFPKYPILTQYHEETDSFLCDIMHYETKSHIALKITHWFQLPQFEEE